MNQTIRTTVLSIQENKGRPRIWLEGKYLEQAGFHRGSLIKVLWLEKQLWILIDETGDRIVCGKKAPVIDINNEKIRGIFQVSDKVRVIVKTGQILVTHTKKEIRKSAQLHDKSAGSVFSGGGLLDEGVKQAGYNFKWAIEQELRYADVWQDNHNGIMHNSDISEVNLDELEPVELLVGGIPCEPFSIARRNGKENETHEKIDLSMFFLMIVEAVNPRTIILEEVPMYIKSEIGQATMIALKRMGYNVEHRVFCGLEHGELTMRSRAVIIASMGKISFPEMQKLDRRMKEILLNPDDPRCEWFDEITKPWVFKAWEDQRRKGNNFQSQIITEDSTFVQTIPKRYFAGQAGNPVVKHPEKDGVYRWLTIDEVRKIMGLPEDYKLDVPQTIAGEVLGQGVLVRVFRKIVEAMA